MIITICKKLIQYSILWPLLLLLSILNGTLFIASVTSTSATSKVAGVGEETEEESAVLEKGRCEEKHVIETYRTL